MCGLVGFVGDGSEANLQAMTDSLTHRGPDGQGIWVDHNKQVFFGHRRLAIIDQAGGAQPMWNATGDIGLIFNGEIFNHLELRAELQAAGYVFASSHSDTEVLIHGYAQWGIELPSRLNGQFAFAIFDRRGNRLFLARDRFGEMPLYRDVRKLPAGHRMIFDLTTRQLEVSSYWQFRLEPDDSLEEKHEAVLVEELRSLLTQAVQ